MCTAASAANHLLFALPLIAAVTLILSTADVSEGATPERHPLRERGLIINQAADALVGYLPLPSPLKRTTPAETVIAGFHKNIDRYVETQVSHIFFNTNYQRTAYPSKVWESYWDVANPETDTSGWPRLTWLVHETGVDLYEVCIDRCVEKGLSPWLSIRMNDTHYHDDPTKMSRLWWEHPEWHLPRDPHNGFDYNVETVRKYYLALIRELLARYDTDGLELDWMRFPWHFKKGGEEEGRKRLTEFMRETRRMTDETAARRGHPIGIAARIPAVPEFAIAMGMDGVTWVQEGLVDILILASVWRPSDTDQPIEEWRERIGSDKKDFVLAAGTDLWIQSAPGGLLMMNTIESMRGFTAAMLDRGADQIYCFNHFHHNTFNRMYETPDGRKVKKNDYRDLLSQTARLETSIDKPRRHVVTWHDPTPRGANNPKQLPAAVSREQSATFRVYTGPKPTSGCVVIRAGLDALPGYEQAKLTARLNGAECRPIDDLKRDGPFVSDGDRGTRVVKTVAEVAPRVVQFEAPLPAVKRGHNAAELSLPEGGKQKVIWLEVYMVP